jgi:hypothetical protein
MKGLVAQQSVSSSSTYKRSSGVGPSLSMPAESNSYTPPYMSLNFASHLDKELHTYRVLEDLQGASAVQQPSRIAGI